MAVSREGLFAAGRRFPMVFWISVIGGALSVLSIAGERLLPLNWQGSLLCDLLLRSLGKTACAISFLTALIIVLVLLRALILLIARGTRTDALQLWLPLAFLFLVPAAHLLIPVRVGYAVWRDDYHRAAARIAARDWPVSREQTVDMPAAQRRLTLTGRASVLREEDRILIFFPIARSLGEYQRWLIYASDDRAPLVGGNGEGDSIQPAVRKLEKNWYDAMVY